MITAIRNLHNGCFGFFQRILQDWFPGLLARFVFAAVLFMYFFNSARTKVGEGIGGLFSIDDGAFIQILPTVMEQYGYDASQIPVFPYHVIVYAGTYAEFILPILIVIGLATRIAAVGMVVFVFIQSFVDITAHSADKETIGNWFDRIPDSTILDQRALWVFLLVYLAIYGAGKVSLDGVLGGKGDAR